MELRNGRTARSRQTVNDPPSGTKPAVQPVVNGPFPPTIFASPVQPTVKNCAVSQLFVRTPCSHLFCVLLVRILVKSAYLSFIHERSISEGRNLVKPQDPGQPNHREAVFSESNVHYDNQHFSPNKHVRECTEVSVFFSSDRRLLQVWRRLRSQLLPSVKRNFDMSPFGWKIDLVCRAGRLVNIRCTFRSSAL